MDSDFYFNKCIVCGAGKQYGRKLQFFKFPDDVDRCRSWVKAIGIRDLIFMPLDDLRQQVVCANHFNPECINERLKRLHKVAIPSQTLYPPLSDELLWDFPKSVTNPDAAPAMPKFRVVEYASIKRLHKEPVLLNTDPVINYERPLMNSLETLIHNERHAVKKPAGILNSIAVPLMTYSSSLEKGTVFAAENPGAKFQLPFMPFVEAVSHNEQRASKNIRISSNKAGADSYDGDISNEGIDHRIKPAKKYTNSKVTALSRQTSACDLPNTTPSEQGFTTADSMFKKPLVGTVKPNLKTVERVYGTAKISAQRDCSVSFGLNTVLTGSPRNGAKDSNAFDGTLKQNTAATNSRYKSIKQYTNNKLTIHSIQKNPSLVPISRTSNQGITVDTTPNTRGGTATDRAFTIKNGYETTNCEPPRKVRANNSTMVYKLTDSELTSGDFSLVPNTTNTNSIGHEDTASPINTKPFDIPATISSTAKLLPSAGSSDTDLMFVPYTQYAAAVAPESTNAHTGEGTFDYGLPLMNCIGTVFQGNIHSNVKTDEEDTSNETAIDIPLMQCFKTLEHSRIL